MERTPLDTTRDFRPGVATYPPPLPVPVPAVPLAATAFVGTAEGDSNEILPTGMSTNGAGSSGLVDGFTAEYTAAIRRFLMDSGVLSANDGVTTIAEMIGFVRGRMF